jgi:hypothetical protein
MSKKKDTFSELLKLLGRLEDARVPFELKRHRYDAVTVVATAPGEIWEIDFLDDGTVDVERFRSHGHLDDRSVIQELFNLWAEPGESGGTIKKPVGPSECRQLPLGKGLANLG